MCVHVTYAPTVSTKLRYLVVCIRQKQRTFSRMHFEILNAFKKYTHKPHTFYPIP